VGSPLALYKKRLPDLVAGLPAVTRYSVGLSVTDQPALRLSLGTATDSDAGVFVQLMGLLPYLAKLKTPERQMLQDIWRQSEFTQDASVAQATIPLDLLLRMYFQ
jgi:hypothetical protein